MKKKILFVVNVDWFFASHRMDLGKAALREGYEVHIATTVTENKIICNQEGFIVHDIYMKRSSINPFHIFRYFLDLIKTINLIRPNIVHLITIKPVLIGGLALKFCNVPAVVFAISGMGYVFIGKKTYHKFLRYVSSIIYRLALNHSNSIVICQNKDDQNLVKNLTNLPYSKFILIKGSGVDINKFSYSKLPSTIPIVMFPSRILVDKGVMEFIEAAKLTVNSTSFNLPARFVVVGMVDTENQASLKLSDLMELEKNKIIEYWGHKNNMEKILPQSSIIVLPSYREGLPKVLSEAAACGRPIITTNVPGCREVIENNISGLLVPAKDSKKLSEAIMKLLLDRDLSSSFGKAGRRYAEKNFAIEKIILQHLEIYKSLFNV